MFNFCSNANREMSSTDGTAIAQIWRFSNNQYVPQVVGNTDRGDSTDRGRVDIARKELQRPAQHSAAFSG